MEDRQDTARQTNKRQKTKKDRQGYGLTETDKGTEEKRQTRTQKDRKGTRTNDKALPLGAG